MIFYRTLILFIASFALVSCGDDKPTDPTESYQYNSFFIYKEKDKKVYVGTVTGLSSCKYIVSTYYTKRRKYIKGEWDYLCCLRTPEAGNECAEQHRYKDD